jgi:hypothetical protein
MSAEEMAGITLSNPRWVISGKTADPSRFLRALRLLAPEGALLFVEGGSHPADLQAFLEARQVDASPRPALGTLWPRHSYYSLPATEENLGEMARLVASLAEPQICDHLHLFSGNDVLVEGHDAFGYEFSVSALVPEKTLAAFCAEAGCRYRTLSDHDAPAAEEKGQANKRLELTKRGGSCR